MGIVLLQDPADLQHILFLAHKACGDDVKTLFNAEQNIAHIGIADIRHGQIRSGHVHTLMVGNRAAVYHTADDIRIRNLLHDHLDQTVVDQDPGACAHIVHQILIGNGCDLIGSHDLVRGQSELLPRHKLRLSALKIPQPDLRSLGIKENGHRHVQLPAHLADRIKFRALLRMISMGKITACNVHSGKDDLSYHFLALRSGSDRADHFGFSHIQFLRPVMVSIMSSEGENPPPSGFSTPCTFSPSRTYLFINLMISSVISSPGMISGIPGG